MTTADERQAAAARIEELIALLRKQEPDTASFRIYNVDRQLAQHAASLPAEARALLEEARRHLEASGFHTRSHQAPV